MRLATLGALIGFSSSVHGWRTRTRRRAAPAQHIEAPDLEATPPVATSEESIRSEYFKFVAMYGKAQASLEAHDERYAVFRDNFLKIQTHNESVDDLGSSPPFTLGVNPFADMTAHEFTEARIGGGRLPDRLRNKPPRVGYSMKVIGADDEVGEEVVNSAWSDLGRPSDSDDGPSAWQLAQVPEYKNWHEEGVVTAPYDQGACGSCWAFSAASTLESLAMITGTEPAGSLQEYSVQQLLDCDEQNFYCTGGWMYEAYEYTAAHGILLRSDYKDYLGRESSCEQPDRFHYKNGGMGEKDGMSNEELRWNVLRQPIGVGIFASSMLQLYHRGIVTEDFLHCSDPGNDVNHGVVVVGFGRRHQERVRGGQCDWYWIVRNSWGAQWGEEGLFKLCADGALSGDLEWGTCQVNRYGTWPTI